ncbi:MAG: 16S rRNA (uracil(1498)-N(3))-methyltransferase [Rhodospirillales bacterium]
MASHAPHVRLFVEAPLTASSSELVVGGARAHYLTNVMRLRVGDRVDLFNGKDGEWAARVIRCDRRDCTLELQSQIAPQTAEPGPWLAFAMVKRSRLDLIIEKATELGVERLLPVITRRTVTAAPNPARLQAIAIEAAEQCRRVSLPRVEAPAELAHLLRDWSPNRPLLLTTPGFGAAPIADICRRRLPVAPGVLIGPEGGFEPSELDELLTLPFVVAVSLGPLVLRAETAAIAALACIQAYAGTWANPASEGVD